MCWSTGVSTWGGGGVGWGVDKNLDIVRFGTYIIQNVRNVSLDSELHGMSQANVNLGIIQDTKIIYGVYARESVVFHVVALGALSLHHGVWHSSTKSRFNLCWDYILQMLFQHTGRPPPNQWLQRRYNIHLISAIDGMK